MNLFLNGHSYRYELEQTLISLFPDRRPVIVPERPESGDFLMSSLSCGNKFITASAKLSLGGKICVKFLRAPNTDSDGLSRKQRDTRLLKRAAYLAAYSLTGAASPWGSLTGIRPAKIASGLLESGKSEKTVRNILTGEYYISPFKLPLVMESALYGIKYKNARAANDISLYIGIPFCPTRCAYCSFVSSAVSKTSHLIPPYLEALKEELSATGKLARELSLNVKSVYVGGGTPTTLSDIQLRELLDRVRGAFSIRDIEVTVEAGRPDTIDRKKLAALKDCGVTRLSINPQSMSDDALSLIGRSHTAKDILDAMALAGRFSFDDINMDLIAGLPGDDGTAFVRSVKECIAMEPTNITIHTLAYKKGSGLSGKYTAGAECGLSGALDRSYSMLRAAGYEPYYLYRQKYMAGGFENTGWCKKGHEGRYNIFIMEELHTILSLGAGGVTKLVNQDQNRIERLINPKYPLEYINGLNKILINKEKIKNFYMFGGLCGDIQL